MRLLCLCPTYGRPALLANSIALFEAQDYPKEDCKLLILDDANQYETQKGENWELAVAEKRFACMPMKYKAMFAMEQILELDCQWDAIVMWDDDDIYLPNHLAAHAEQLRSFPWSQPKRVYCAYDPITIENVGGNMWASCAVRTNYIRKFSRHKLNEWFDDKRAAFDLFFLAMLEAEGGRSDELSFMFRWGSTQVPHLQGFIKSQDDLEAYRNFPQHNTEFVRWVLPQFDPETRRMLGKQRFGLLPK